MVQPPTDPPFLAEEVIPWEPPKPKKRKPKKPRHGDDSVLIGLEISFDPTAELLVMDSQPRYIRRTRLEKLQKLQQYEDRLLGNDESSDEKSSGSDFLGFHLDCLGSPFLPASHISDLKGHGSSEAEEENEEIEIEFFNDDNKEDDKEDFENT